jgi:hypothetical protein
MDFKNRSFGKINVDYDSGTAFRSATFRNFNPHPQPFSRRERVRVRVGSW